MTQVWHRNQELKEKLPPRQEALHFAKLQKTGLVKCRASWLTTEQSHDRTLPNPKKNPGRWHSLLAR